MTTANWQRSLGFAACISVGLIGVSLRLVVAEEKPENPKPPPPKITISKETTWATEPVRQSGFVDYFEAINRRFDRGVTPQNNAVVLLYQAMGPSPEGTRQPDRFFERLGIERLPDDGNYFQSLGKWFQNAKQGLRKPQFRTLADEQTAAYSRPWKAEEFPEIAEWLTANEEPLRLVTEATGRTHYFSPLMTDDEDGQFIAVLLPGIQMSRELARALTARAMLHLADGAGPAAWRDLMTVHRLGRLVGQGPTLIEGLVGCAIEGIAIQAELRLISESRPSAKFVALYVKNLQRLPPRALIADKIDIAERVCFLDCAHHIARGKMGLSDLNGGGNVGRFLEKFAEALLVQSVDWDEILKSGNQWYDRLAAAGRKPTYRERVAALNGIEAEVKALVVRRSGPQALLQILGGKPALTQMTSDMLISSLLPGDQTIWAEQRITQRMQNLEVALALAAWRSEHDSYPASLDALVPKYLATPPQDTFIEKPLHYEKLEDGYRFYSVGENEKDDAGLSFDDTPRGDDLGVRMPLPPPKPD